MKEERILIVDGEHLAREMMQETLKREGYHVFAVGSAGAALRQAKKEHFDLVLADAMMPSKGGLQVVERLREVSPDTIPLLIRGNHDMETARAAMRMGIYDCIMNPFESSELCAAIAKAVRRRWLIQEAERRRRLVKDDLHQRQFIEGHSLLKRLAGPMMHKRAVKAAAPSNT